MGELNAEGGASRPKQEANTAGEGKTKVCRAFGSFYVMSHLRVNKVKDVFKGSHRAAFISALPSGPVYICKR